MFLKYDNAFHLFRHHQIIVNQRTLVWKRRQTSNEYSIILFCCLIISVETHQKYHRGILK